MKIVRELNTNNVHTETNGMGANLYLYIEKTEQGLELINKIVIFSTNCNLDFFFFFYFIFLVDSNEK